MNFVYHRPARPASDFWGIAVVESALEGFLQFAGEPMKFLTLADWTGMVETELFAATYRGYALATVRHQVLEITARVEPFENGRGSQEQHDTSKADDEDSKTTSAVISQAALPAVLIFRATA